MFETRNVSPLRYPGGKTRACKQLDQVLNENYKISGFVNIVSPFFGGGSFEFYLQNTHGLPIIANDKFTPLSNFWVTAKEHNAELCNRLREWIGKVDKAEFAKFRDSIINSEDTMEQSVMYFIINRCSFSGATLSGGFSSEASAGRFTTSSIDRIQALELSEFQMYNLDFEEFINQHYTPDSLLFLDPPYYLENGSKLYGKNGDLHENFDHERLHRCISKLGNWMLTYNDCEYIRELYSDFAILDAEWGYSMNKSKKSSEIVILG
jgi:DNA adenine methylase